MAADQRDEELIFHTALAMPVAERPAYLRAVCGNDPERLAQFESLLAAYEVRDGFLEAPPVGENARFEDSLVVEAPGTIIGRYKLLEKIGEGGMAVVYMAEQEQPIRRKVALKIIKLGMDTRQVIARFEAERQALGMMDHPCIAKVLDAGATETGRPYFVMELVQGVSITEYCDRNSLSTKERLGLFIQVCNAVQHAHQKGIIHRDLKPSNVMVTHHDGKPVPKVIDFGIAKAMVRATHASPLLTEKTFFTRYGHIIGTPAYMSPEQAELSDLDIDTRSDIYSLGVLLYELLTGTTPFSEEELRKAGYVEMQRVIREQEPVKPSTRIRAATRERRSVGAGPRACPTSGGHGGPPLREVQGDLDWIVMKSLEKDRTHRYETAHAMAVDVQRHLASEPVLARAPGTIYRMRKLLRRHQSQVLAALMMAVVALAAAIMLSQWNQARQELDEARESHHKGLLSQAREQYARTDRQAALKTLQSIPDGSSVGPEAHLLRAGILVDDRRFEEAQTLLRTLLNERREVAGAAYSLLARILWESESLDGEKLKEIDEYQQRAQALLPETAEAYYLRALTAVTIKEQLDALKKALDLAALEADPLDPVNYECRRLRAFIYYASRKYDRLHEDASAMTVLRPRDPLGYSLRAAAAHELGKYADAIAEYEEAMRRLSSREDPQYVDLAIQRCEVFLRMGEYQRVIAETREHLKSSASAPVSLQYHLFCALTALGDYQKADDLSRQIIGRGHEARLQWENWCTKYVFDVLAAGRSWHPADHSPTGSAFLPMVEAEETYRNLSAKGRLVVRDGFSAQWSPDGKRLAFSLGVLGRSGVAVYDSVTKQTDLLIVPGKYPKWSPDGQYIAFVRDRQFMRVPEFVAADPKKRPPAATDEEIWLMKADGTKPRRLARGVWPSWDRDSSCVYYRSRPDSMLYSISILDEAAEARRTMPCPGYNPSVSPDNQHVAYMEGTSLKVMHLASQAMVAEWPLPLPSDGWGASAWSPDGNELCLGGSGRLENRTGLWIYRLDRPEPATTLSGQITIGSWAPDGTKLVFELGAPHYEIWTAELAPGASTIEALGPARTVEEHLHDLVTLQTRKIQADPLDAYAYSNRARCYDCLHDSARANADMRRWSAAVSGKLPWDFRRVINLPFDCELVFSAERPVNTIPMISVAFGQKGRCEMRLFEIPVVVASLLGFGFLSGLHALPAHADLLFGEATNLGPTVNSGYHDFMGCPSPDGLELYFCSNRPGGYGGYDIWVSKRKSAQDSWDPPVNLGPQINVSSAYDAPGSLSADGLILYFESGWDLCTTTRATRDAPWGPRVSLGRTVVPSTSYLNALPIISSDGLELYFSSGRPRGYGEGEMWVTTRATSSDSWGPPVNLGPVVSAPATESPTWLSPDGLTLIFFSDRPGGFGSIDVWMTTRPLKGRPWSPPKSLGPSINTKYSDWISAMSPDGRWCYISDYLGPRPGGLGGSDLWQAPIIPIVDFNGDVTVDAADMALLEVNWGKSNSICDIGPFAWGDGVVDERDLAVLMESLMTPGPKTADVPYDAILSWTGPSFAEGYDVYFGTSLDDVRNATREDPCGVLVSMGQTETTYDPNGVLEFSRTYYWRIDTVLGPSNAAVCKGPVLSFTTEPFAHPIKNIIARASSSASGSGPDKTVDGSGLDTGDGHSTDVKTMWQSGNVSPHWIQFEFDKLYTLHELWVWNSNQTLESVLGFGAKTVKIEYSTDGTAWTPLEGVPEFAQAPGEPGYTASTTISFGGVSAMYVKLTVEKGWGATPAVGLSEVRFFHIPDRSATSP